MHCKKINNFEITYFNKNLKLKDQNKKIRITRLL